MLDSQVNNQQLECNVQYCLGTFDFDTQIFTPNDPTKCGTTSPSCDFDDDLDRTFLWED